MRRPMARTAGLAVLELMGLRAEEFRRSRRIAVAYALLLAGLYVLKPARNALFLDVLGAERLPLALLVTAATGAAVAFVLAKGLHHVAIERALPRFLLLGALFVALLRGQLAPASSSAVFAFYVGVNLFGQLGTALLWLWANAAFDAREARRVFGWIAALGILGAFLGGLITHELARRLGTLDLLWIAVGLLLAASLALWSSPRLQRRQASAVPQGLLVDFRGSSLVQLLAYVVLVAGAVSALVDLEFNAVVDAALPSQDGKTAFFGGFFASLNAGAFLFQLLLSTRLLNRLGIGAGLLLLPSALTLGSLGVLFFPLLPAAVALKAADVGLRHSVYRSVVEVLFVPLPALVRSRARVLLDAAFDNFGTGVGAGIGLVLVESSGFGLSGVSLATLGLLAVWFWLAYRVRPAYLSALRAGLSRRQIHPQELLIELQNPAQRELLLASLSSRNSRQVHYSLDVLLNARVKDLAEPLRPLFAHADPSLREKALRVLNEQRDASVTARAHPLLDDPDPMVQRQAMLVLVNHASDPLGALREFLEATNASRWQAALSCIADGHPPSAGVLLDDAVFRRVRAETSPAGVQARAQMARALARSGASSAREKLDLLLLPEELEVTLAVILAQAELRDPERLPWLLSLLEDRRFRAAAMSSLASYGPSVYPALIAFVRGGGSRARDWAARILRQAGDRGAAECLFRLATETAPAGRWPLLEACVALRLRDPELRFPTQGARVLLQSEADWHSGLTLATEFIANAQGNSTATLLQRALREKRKESVQRLFRCLLLVHPATDIQSAQVGLQSAERRTRARALELLDQLLSPEERKSVFSLIEPGAEALNPQGDPLQWLLEQGDEWLRICAGGVIALRSKPLPVAHGSEVESSPVLSTLEKVMLLQNADVFAEATTEQLALIAAIATERDADTGTRVYSEADPSDAMYVIVEGRVRLHRGDTDVNVAAPGESFGAWALFDEAARLTSATALENSRLLCIRHDDFIDVLSDHVEITRAMLASAARRLRAVLQRVGAETLEPRG